MVSTVSPKANETPRSPIPRAGNAAASTALPQPPRTSQKVPRNSLESFENTRASFDVLRAAIRSRIRDGLDVGQNPLLLEELLLGPVGAEHQLERPSGIGRDPVALLAGR